MAKKTPISPEDAELFRDAVKKTSPLPNNGRTQPRSPNPASHPRFTGQDERDVIEPLLDRPIHATVPDTGDELEYRQDGVQLSVMRKLKRGQLARQDEIDLHGMTVAQARGQVVAFLDHACSRGLRCVRIIHGKGLRSSQRGPVLKPQVAHWLRQRNEVLAYCSAQTVEGGSGAVYVLLRRG